MLGLLCKTLTFYELSLMFDRNRSVLSAYLGYCVLLEYDAYHAFHMSENLGWDILIIIVIGLYYNEGEDKGFSFFVSLKREALGTN